MTVRRTTSPFDADAVERHRRMGLIDERDKPKEDAIRIVAQAHAGMFFDDLSDSADEDEAALSAINQIYAQVEAGESRQALLSICMAYDGMRRPLPELIWWISGSAEIIPLFLQGFAEGLKSIQSEWRKRK